MKELNYFTIECYWPWVFNYSPFQSFFEWPWSLSRASPFNPRRDGRVQSYKLILFTWLLPLHDSYHHMTHWRLTGWWLKVLNLTYKNEHWSFNHESIIDGSFLAVLAFEPVLNYNKCYLKISPNKGFKKLKVAKRIRFISDIMSDRKQVR